MNNENVESGSDPSRSAFVWIAGAATPELTFPIVLMIETVGLAAGIGAKPLKIAKSMVL